MIARITIEHSAAARTYTPVITTPGFNGVREQRGLVFEYGEEGFYPDAAAALDACEAWVNGAAAMFGALGKGGLDLDRNIIRRLRTD